jgi:hypothetical protein
MLRVDTQSGAFIMYGPNRQPKVPLAESLPSRSSLASNRKACWMVSGSRESFRGWFAIDILSPWSSSFSRSWSQFRLSCSSIIFSNIGRNRFLFNRRRLFFNRRNLFLKLSLHFVSIVEILVLFIELFLDIGLLDRFFDWRTFFNRRKTGDG